MDTHLVFVPGIVPPKGSHFSPAKGVTVACGASRIKAWTKSCGFVALHVKAQHPTEYPIPKHIPAVAKITILEERPKSHLFKTGQLRATAPLCPIQRDLDKQVRTVLDALSGVLYYDDVQVRRIVAEKDFAVPGEEPGCYIIVRKDEEHGES